MNVEENVCYSLKIKKIPKIEQESQVEEILSTVKLTGYEKKNQVNSQVVNVKE